MALQQHQQEQQYEQFLKQQKLLEKEKYERDQEIENIKSQQQQNEEQILLNQMSLVNFLNIFRENSIKLYHIKIVVSRICALRIVYSC